MSVALLFRRTPVRNVPLPRAWSPPPSGPPSAVWWFRPPRTWTCALERLERLEGPLELEVGPLAARPPGGRDGAVGEVDEGRPQRRARGGRRPGRAGPVGGEQPGRAQRRERRQRDRGAQPAEEMAAAEAVAGRREAFGSSPVGHDRVLISVGSDRPAGAPVREVGGLHLRRSAALLERGGFDDARDQGRGAAVLRLDPLHDRVDGLHVGRLEAAAEGIGQQLLGQAAVEVAAMPLDQDPLQLPDVPERFARDQLARRRRSGRPAPCRAIGPAR